MVRLQWSSPQLSKIAKCIFELLVKALCGQVVHSHCICRHLLTVQFSTSFKPERLWDPRKWLLVGFDQIVISPYCILCACICIKTCLCLYLLESAFLYSLESAPLYLQESASLYLQESASSPPARQSISQLVSWPRACRNLLLAQSLPESMYQICTLSTYQPIYIAPVRGMPRNSMPGKFSPLMQNSKFILIWFSCTLHCLDIWQQHVYVCCVS